MLDYKRFVSYVYRYIEGEKKGNVGYIRCEQRQGNCRFTLNLLDRQGIEGGCYKVYLYKVDTSGSPIGYYLDEMKIHKGSGELRKQTGSDNVWNTNHRLEDFEGVIAIYDKEHMYVSQWSDEPIRTAQFLTYNEWKKKKEPEISKAIYVREEGNAVAEGERINTSSMIMEPFTAEVENLVVESIEAVKATEVLETSALDERISKSKDGVMEIGKSYDMPKDIRRNQKEEDSQSLEDTFWQNVRRSMAQAREQAQNSMQSGEQDITDKKECANAEKALQDIVNNQSEKKEKQILETSKVTDTIVDTMAEELLQKIGQESKIEKKVSTRNAIADATLRLMKQRPKLPDFENHEIYDCVRIEPNDIGLLEMENWKLGVNSFLSHGYYNYKYLMLGKLRFQDGVVKAVLGVPGVFDNKEQYIAKIFGFEVFVPVKHTNVKTGNFGYWIVELV